MPPVLGIPHKRTVAFEDTLETGKKYMLTQLSQRWWFLAAGYYYFYALNTRELQLSFQETLTVNSLRCGCCLYISSFSLT